MEQIRIILQHHASGRSIRWIAASTGASRNTVRGYIRLVLESGQSASQALSATDEQLAKLVFDRTPPPEDARSAVFTQLLGHWTKELARTHVTRQILWREYRLAHPDVYEAILAMPVHLQPDAHELLARLAQHELESKQNKRTEMYLKLSKLRYAANFEEVICSATKRSILT